MSSPRMTVLCHFYNEEFLLPFWLRHHRRIFDHGILIDYDSTDRSVEIIRRLAPEWTVVRSRNREFAATPVDEEVMEHEREAGAGWKVALNVTEFLFYPDLRAYLAAFEEQDPETAALGIPSFVMVDRLEDRGRPVDPSQDLFLQRHHGFRDTSETERRLRFLHRASDGGYAIGRHGTRLSWRFAEGLSLLWFGFSPYEQTRDRKLQIQTRIPESDRKHGWGWQHMVTSEELDERWRRFAASSRDLREDPLFRRTFDHFAGTESRS